MDVALLRPTLLQLPAFVEALKRDWSPDNVRGPQAAAEALGQIDQNPAGLIDSLDDPDAKAPPIMLPDGTSVTRLPSITRWIWDGAFCGSIGLRWAPGTPVLPQYVLDHIGFAVVPWKRNLGRATRALALVLPEAKSRGLDYVELTADPDNAASCRVIEACGGQLVERFQKSAAYGGGESLRFRIVLT